VVTIDSPWIDSRVGHPCFGSDEQWHHTPGTDERCEDCGWFVDVTEVES
jgi:hypothetical protein